MAIQPLEAELLSLLGGDEKARIVSRYCGFDGLGGTTLQTVGSEFGITAERVRQIVGEVVRRRGNSISPAPSLLKAIALVSARVPGFADEIEAALQSGGLSAVPFRIEGLLRAAELCGRPAGFSLTETQRTRLVHDLSSQSLDSVIREARRAVERRGMATVHGLLHEVAGVAPEAATPRMIIGALTATDELHWLGEPGDWFWLPSVSRNPVVRRIRKILSVANPVSFAELYGAVSREYRLVGDPPPPPVLLDLCRQIPGLQVEDEQVRAKPPIDPAEVLGELELAIVQILTEHGGWMRRSDLAVACDQRGLNRSSFYSALTQSPVTTHHPAGMLGLIGTVRSQQSAVKPAAQRSKYLHAKARSHTIRLHKWMP